MVINYIPLDIHSICNYLKVDEPKSVNLYLYNVFKEYFNKNYCKHLYLRGKNKGYICGSNTKGNRYCKKHNNINSFSSEKVKIHYCIGKSRRRERCGRIVKDENQYCYVHNKPVDYQNNINFTGRKEEKNDLSIFKEIECLVLINKLNYAYIKEGNTIRIKTSNFNIVLTGNKFIDNFTGKGGKGILDLYIYISKKPIKEAIEYLKKTFFFLFPTSKYLVNNSFTSGKNDKNDNSLVNLKENVININNIKRYLVEVRKINKELIESLIDRNLISSDDKNNCIFYNEHKKYAQIKGTINKSFVLSLGMSDFIEYKNANNPLYLFESPIDALSYITLKDGNVEGNFVSTNGAMMINRVNNLVIKYNTNKLFLCFDNDKQGEIFCEMVKEKLKEYNIIFIRNKPKYKDFNEDLCRTSKK